jgi:hypothetical protein
VPDVPFCGFDGRLIGHALWQHRRAEALNQLSDSEPV